jgi:hypothetical protein
MIKPISEISTGSGEKRLWKLKRKTGKRKAGKGLTQQKTAGELTESQTAS